MDIYNQPGMNTTEPYRPIIQEGDLNNSFAFAEKTRFDAFCWFRVEALGFGKDTLPNQEDTSQTVGELTKAAMMFTSLGVPFSILCERRSEEDGIVFAVGCENELFVPSILRAAFKTARFKEYDYCEPHNNFLWNACSFESFKTDCDEISKKKPIKDIQISEWVDQTARFLFDTLGMVRVDFYPVLSNDELKKTIKGFENDYDQAAKYIETNMTSSTNNSQDIQPGWLKKMTNALGSEAKGSSSVGYSFAVKNADSKIEKSKKAAEYYSNLYENAGKDGWVIDFSVASFTNSEAEAGALMTPVSAAIVQSGYTCKWEQFEKNGNNKKKRGLVLPLSMAIEFISFPTTSFYGFERMINKYYCVNLPQYQKNDNDTTEGEIKMAEMLQFNEPTGVSIALPKNQLTRHLFVCGMTGSGKTNSVHQILSNVGDLPFLVIEPVKGEYHSLPGVEAFTMTAGSSLAFYNNPFWFPAGSNLQYHIDCLKQIITSAFDLYAAMPNILEQCLTLIYQHSGWDLVTGKNHYENDLPENMLYPTFSDLCREVERYLEDSKFSEELKGDYKGCLLSRLQSFTTGSKGMLLNTTEHASYEDIANKKIIISLDSLADDADKSIVMGVILAQYFQFVKVRSAGLKDKRLKHLTVIEEAHHLFAGDAQPQTSSSGKGSGQSSAQTFVKTLNNMLAEIRAYGDGFVIVDQSPSALHPSVLKNTATKIAHRVDYGQDIEALRDVLLLDKDDNELSMLNQGDALIRYEGMRLPVKAHVDKCETKENSEVAMSEEISGNSILNHLLEDASMKDAVKGIIEKLLMQLMFDNVSSIKDLYAAFILKMTQQFIIFGHSDVLTNEDNEDIIIEYASSFFESALRVLLPSQYLIVKLVTMYAKRVLMLAMESENNPNENELSAFSEYRKARIWPRLNRFFQFSGNDDYKIEKTIVGNCPEIGLIRTIISCYLHSKNQNDEKIKELVNAHFLVDASTEYYEYISEKIRSLLKSHKYTKLFA